MLAAGTIESQHVAFAYAGSKTKGGAAEDAEHAKTADAAKAADFAKNADAAATADEAKSAAVAASLKCTGCVAAGHVNAGFAADLIKSGQLHKVAASGKYADLDGGPDLAPYARLDKSNAFLADNDYGKKQALNFRLQNTDKDPVSCDKDAIGLIYYHVPSATLRVCNGSTFTIFAYGAIPESPATSCQHILDSAGPKKSGLYWLDTNGGSNADAFQVWCEQEKDGGGWTKLMSAQWKFFFGANTWQNYAADNPQAENYSILAKRAAWVLGDGTRTYRFNVGNGGIGGPQAHVTVWQQKHDPFTETTNGSDYKYISGDQSSTCGGFNGLHHKYQGYSYTSDPDSGDSSGCWWMQVVPHTDYDNKGYLEGYGGAGNYHQWQVLWVR
jgi:hypothetical protein